MAVRSVSGARRDPERLDIPFRSVSMRTLPPRRSNVVDRVRGEFVEMRGFSPTVQQAARLFDLPADACRDILSSLEREGFLTHTADGRYRLQQ